MVNFQRQSPQNLISFARQLTSPILCVVPLYLSGLFSTAIPAPLLAIALLIMGTSVGSSFYGFDRRLLAKLSLHSIVSVMVLLCVATCFAFIAWLIADIPFIAGILAFSPGGIAEMSLIALTLNVDPAFVVTHHLCRIIFCLSLGPIIGHFLGPHPKYRHPLR